MVGIISILSNTVVSKCIPNILGEVTSKNALVRAKVTKYMGIMLENFPDEVIEKYIDSFSSGKRF